MVGDEDHVVALRIAWEDIKRSQKRSASLQQFCRLLWKDQVVYKSFYTYIAVTVCTWKANRENELYLGSMIYHHVKHAHVLGT